MDKLSEEIIAHVKALPNPYGRFSCSHVARALKRDKSEVRAACEYLVKKGYAELNNGGYRLTHTAAKKRSLKNFRGDRFGKTGCGDMLPVS